MHIESFILAAGASKRTGKINKLTKKYKNKPLIEHIEINQGWRHVNMNIYNFKKEIRRTYNVNTLIHISDNISETIHNSSILYLFQENTIYQNNLIYTIRYENEKLKMKNMDENLLSELNKNLFNDFINSIKKCGFNSDDFCIDGSFILSILGLREGRDLNFICLDNNISSLLSLRDR